MKFLYWQTCSIYSTAIWKQWIHCRSQKESRTIPLINSQNPPNLSYKRYERLSWAKITDHGILKIVAKLDRNETHGHDKISIRMIKIYSTSICKTIKTHFQPLHRQWYKSIRVGKIVPIHKKGDKKSLKNCYTVSLLRICSTIFERLLYNVMFGFFLDKGLISANESGFKPGDSCINKLLWITHNIYKSFNDGYEVRGIFLDISKALDKVWHDGLIFKL